MLIGVAVTVYCRVLLLLLGIACFFVRCRCCFLLVAVVSCWLVLVVVVCRRCWSVLLLVGAVVCGWRGWCCVLLLCAVFV